jgi:methyl-accepting chemotaxis protein
MVGQSIDIFHKNPTHQRTMLADPSRLPHRAVIRVGPEYMQLDIQAIKDTRGRYLGPMLTWSLITEKFRLADQFEQSVKSVVDVVASAVVALKESAQSLTATASQTLKQSMVVSAAAEESTRSTETVAAATEELSASISEIARQVENAKVMAEQAARESDATNQKVQQLEDAATSIGRVLDVINGISEQINLLALNATIEAARAGEAGKGFAVVAGEVKILAGQAGEATGDIARQIADIQRATKTSAEAMATITATVGNISSAQTDIDQAVTQQSGATAEISRSIQEASVGALQVSTNIVDVRTGAEKMEDSIKNIALSADDLEAQSRNLSAAVDGFLLSVRS